MAKKSKTKKRNKPARKSTKAKFFYSLNPEFELFGELRSMVLKSLPGERGKIVKRINGLGRVKLAVVSGVFINSPDDVSAREPKADLFIVGDDIDKRKLTFFLRFIEAEVGKEIKFSMMEKEEFEYRFSMFDRFVREILEGPHEKLINKLEL